MFWNLSLEAQKRKLSSSGLACHGPHRSEGEANSFLHFLSES